MFARILFTALFFFVIVFADAQSRKQSYIVYKVKSGESFRSIAAKYDLNEQDLADYNNLEYYSGPIAAKSLRIPIKVSKKDATVESKPIQQNKKVIVESSSAKPAPESTTVESKPVVVVGDSTSKVADAEPEVPTFQTDVKKHLPVILFIGGSLVLLAAAIGYYKFVSRR